MSFEIKVGKCTIEFREFRHRSDSGFDIEILAHMPYEGKDNCFYDASEWIGNIVRIGTLELNQMPSFDKFKDHILRVVPEEAKREGVEPFEITNVITSGDLYVYEEVTLSVIAAGEWRAFDVKMTRHLSIETIKYMRYSIGILSKEVEKLRGRLEKALSKKE